MILYVNEHSVFLGFFFFFSFALPGVEFWYFYMTVTYSATPWASGSP